MKRNNLSKKQTALLAFGLLVQSLPFLLNGLFKLDDFANGFIRGIGLTLIVFALIKMKLDNNRLDRNQKSV